MCLTDEKVTSSQLFEKYGMTISIPLIRYVRTVVISKCFKEVAGNYFGPSHGTVNLAEGMGRFGS